MSLSSPHQDSFHFTITSPSPTTKTITTLVHTDLATVQSLLLTALPSLISTATPSPAAPSLDLFEHAFNLSIKTSFSPSGKPICTDFPFVINVKTGDDQAEDPEDDTCVGDTTTIHDLAKDPAKDPVGDTTTIHFTSPAGTTGTAGTSICFQLSSKPHNTTLLTIAAFLPRSIPSKALPPLLTHLLSPAVTLHNRFARHTEVDKATYVEFIEEIPTAPPLKLSEIRLIDLVLSFDNQGNSSPSPFPTMQPTMIKRFQTVLPSAPWRRIPDTIRSPVSYYQKIESDSTTWGKATATIDVAALQVFAHVWCLSAHENKLVHFKREGSGALRLVHPLPSSHSMLYANVAKFGLGISDRVFATWFTWSQAADGSYIVAFTKHDECGSQNHIQFVNDAIRKDPAASRAIVGTVEGFWRFKPVADNVCEVTYLLQVKLNGSIPAAILNSRIKSTLGLVGTVRKFRRKGRLVDEEMRKAAPTPPHITTLTDDQAAIFANCSHIDTATSDSNSNASSTWSPLKSPTPGVAMWIKHAKGVPGERSVSLGKAVVDVDTDVHNALYYMFDYCSRERCKVSEDEGNPVRVIVRENGRFDNVVATIKSMPFPMRNREFVGRQCCAVDTNGDLVAAFVPIDDVIDNGIATNMTVRGRTRAFMRFSRLSDKQCRATLVQYIDAGGKVPMSVMNFQIPKVLDGFGYLRTEFVRDDDVDKAERDHLAAGIRDSVTEYSTAEDEIFQLVQSKLGGLNDDALDEQESPDHLVTMGGMFIDGESSGVMRGSVTVDAAVEECAAWEIAKMSRMNVAEHRTFGGLDREFLKENDHHYRFHVAYDFGVGFQPRDFMFSLLWKRQGTKVLVSYQSVEHPDFPHNPNYVRATSAASWVYETMPPVGSVPQTRVTYTFQVDMGGAIPKFVINGQGVSTLMYLSTMRKRFDRSAEIDATTRKMHSDVIASRSEVYSEEETKILDKGLGYFAAFDRMKGIRKIIMGSSLTTGRIAFNARDTNGWGWASTVVRAGRKEVLSWVWDTHSRATRRDDDLERSTDDRPNDHSFSVYIKKKIALIRNRDFLARCVWREIEGGYLYVSSPEESVRRPKGGDVVRGKYPSAMRITWRNENETFVEYVMNPDAGGNIPSFIMNGVMASNLTYVTEIQEYYQALRGLEAWDADDGIAVGEVMCVKTKAEKHHKKGESRVGARVRGIFERHVGLGEMARKHEFFQSMITRVAENKLRLASDVASTLCELSAAEGKKIGVGLALSMATNLTAEAGVDVWIGRYKSLGELDRENVWFRPMMCVMAKRLLGKVSWGVKMRVAMGAGLSIVDLATDIFVIIKYLDKPETRDYGFILMCMIGASIFMQSISAIMQNSKKPRVVMKELLVVFTGLKPGLDAFRVASGKQMEEHHAVDAMTELTVMKVVEMTCESIPGCCLQSYAVLKNGDYSSSTIGSLLVSAFTTGFTSASISFDYDVDPGARKRAPHLYGYIPNGATRTVVFGCMLANSTLLLLIRSFSAALLMLVEKRYFIAYLAGDHALHLLYKVMRGDLIYWAPLPSFASVIIRVLVKTLCDFTGVIQFRHPCELGGLYWTGNTLLALIASLASVWFYFERGGDLIDRARTWTLAGSACGSWLLVFGLFLLLIKKGFRRTFFSTKLGKDDMMDYFTEGKDDATKSEIFTVNKALWQSIREDVKKWIETNWWRWKEEKPDWYTELFVASVPPDWIPLEDEEIVNSIRERVRKLSRRQSSRYKVTSVSVAPSS